MLTFSSVFPIFRAMKRSPRILVILCTIVFMVSVVAFGEVVNSNSLQASSDGVNVTLRWTTVDETSVVSFEVQRSSGMNGEFISIGNSLAPKGTSVYEFIDHSAFMRTTSIYQYRVMVVFANGDRIPTKALTVSHTVSGVRRTWGSIKSLFR